MLAAGRLLALRGGRALAGRSYSDSVPLHKIHSQLQDVEGLFRKHRLHELDSQDKIDALVRSGAISEHIGGELSHDLKVQQEAGSTAEGVLVG